MIFWILGGVVLAIYSTALWVTAANRAHDKAYKAGREDGSFATLSACYAHIDAGGEPLTLGFFEQHAHTTVTSELYGTPDWFTHLAFKNFGEAGEFAEHVGKASRDDGWSIFKGVSDLKPERRMALLKELGDQLWYIVMLAHELGSSLAEVMWINITKRNGRRERGTMKGAGDNR